MNEQHKPDEEHTPDDEPDEEQLVRTRPGGTAWYEAEPAPPALLEKRFAELNELNRTRNRNLEDEQLDARYGAKLAQLEALLTEVELDDEIRERAGEQLQHAREVWATDPIQRRRALGGEQP